MASADLVVTTITVPLDPKLDCASTDPNALLLPVDYDDAMAPEAFHDAVIYCVDDLGQYGSVADDLYFFGLAQTRYPSGRGGGGRGRRSDHRPTDVPQHGNRHGRRRPERADPGSRTRRGVGRYIEFP